MAGRLNPAVPQKAPAAGGNAGAGYQQPPGPRTPSGGEEQITPPKQPPSPQPPASPWGQPGQAPWSQAPSRDFNYQPAFNGMSQAVNPDGAYGSYAPVKGSADGNRATSDLQKSLSMEADAQGAQEVAQVNAAQNQRDQIARSEAMQQAMANQARLYSDATNRSLDQLSLASQIQQAMMNSRMMFRGALMGDA